MTDISRYELKPSDLKPNIAKKHLRFKSTENLKSGVDIVGQDRAKEALNFGINMKAKGYNIYVAGYPGTGRSSYVKKATEEYSTKNYKKGILKDYCYVYNYKNRYKPIVIELEQGEGRKFKKNIESMVEKIRENIDKEFNSVKYGNNTMKLDFDYDAKLEKIIDDLNEKSIESRVFFQLGQNGIVSLPLNEDYEVMSEEEMEQISDEDIEIFKKNQNKLRSNVSKTLDKLRRNDEEFAKKLKDYELEIITKIIDSAMARHKKYYKDNKKIITYLEDMKEDMVDNMERFKPKEGKGRVIFTPRNTDGSPFFQRYEVNLFIDNEGKKTLPIIHLSNPTYYEINGYYEYKNRMNTLQASFMDIVPGALHQAKGGFLIMQVKDLLSNPYSWECVKRSLKSEKVVIDTLYQNTSYIVTSSLKPEGIDLDVKIILIGDTETYSLLYELDEDFEKLFKVTVEFDIEMEIKDSLIKDYIRIIASQCEKRGLKHLTPEAVEMVLNYSCRISESKNMLTARISKIVELLLEADAVSNGEIIEKEDVKEALENKKYRNGNYEDYLNRRYKDGSLLIDIEGEKSGQINALVVISDGERSFGEPAKLTASTFMGKEGVINIERETKQSGSTHDKGVMILSGYFGERYSREDMLSFTTSMTFEQNYGYIDGDSASSTELYLMFSSIANIPIKQYIAVTGSVSQKGEIQPIGGVNEKIEGFFRICSQKGLTGKQGVMIPKLNVQNLVLNKEVIEAVSEGTFHIYAIDNVDQGLYILTGLTKRQIDKKINDALEVFKEGEE